MNSSRTQSLFYSGLFRVVLAFCLLIRHICLVYEVDSSLSNALSLLKNIKVCINSIYYFTYILLR